MALKPPSRWGSSSTTGNGLNRRRERPSEMLIAQTYGEAAGAVLAFNTFPEFEAKTGTVTGSATSSGTVSGIKGGYGTATGETTSTGTISGTKYDPSAPVVVRPAGGMSAYRRAQIAAAQQMAAEQAVEHHAGTVRGVTRTSGTIRGTASRSGRTITSPVITYRTHITGTKATTTRIASRAETRGRVIATAVSMVDHAELRRLRDDAELLLLI
jgi:hypothetical protein